MTYPKLHCMKQLEAERDALLEQKRKLEAVGMSMTMLLSRLGRLSDERDQAAVKAVIAQWDTLAALDAGGA